MLLSNFVYINAGYIVTQDVENKALAARMKKVSLIILGHNYVTISLLCCLQCPK